MGVQGCDINNYCVYSDNYTLFVDQSNPSVSLISPTNGTSVYTDAITFNYNVTDYGISSCDLLINDAVNVSDSSVSLNTQESLSTTLSNGNYTWDVGCMDNSAGIANSSLKWDLIVCKPSWSCGAWSNDDDECGTRTCTDSNSCDTDTDKPDTSESCPGSGGSSSGGGSSGGGASGAAAEDSGKATISFDVNAGDTKTFSISKDVGISGLELDFKNAVSGAQVTVEKLDDKPSSVPAIENTYAYVSISPNFVDDDLKEAKVKFTIPKNWILINALNNPTNIYLSRYNDGSWQKLETLTAGVDGDNQKYEAITPGFSYFAISANQLTLEEAIQTEVLEDLEESNETEDNSTAGITQITGGFSRVKDWFTGKSLKNIIDLEGSNKYYWIASVVLGISLIYILFRYKGKSGKFGGLMGETLGKISFPTFRRDSENETSPSLSDKLIDHDISEIRENKEPSKREIRKLKKQELKLKKKEEKERRLMEKKERKEKERGEKILKLSKIKEERTSNKKDNEIKDNFNVAHDKTGKWQDFELEDF